MDAKSVIKTIKETYGEIRQIYWVACGGSLVDLYPAHCMVLAESTLVESGIYTSKEFILATPKKLGKNSLVVLCTHSGGTKETLEAAELSLARGAAVVTMTHNPDSAANSDRWISWVYPWGEGQKTRVIPSGISLSIAAELLAAQEEFTAYDALMDGIDKMDAIVEAAKTKVNAELCDRFAALCQEHKFLYILGSGATFSQTYGFAICSLMEMQWQHCAYLHSGEYFHGPFEVTENGVFYFLQKSSGKCRPMDERAEDFLKTHTDALMVLDALEYGMDVIDPAVRDYLDPVLFYAMNCELRSARGKVFNHDVDYRRYMGKVPY